MYKLDFKKVEETEIKLPTSAGSSKKKGNSKKNIYFTDYAKAFDCVDHDKLCNSLKEMGIPDHLTCLWETCIQDKKQQLELDIEQCPGSKLGKEYDKAIYIVTLNI